MLGGIKIFTLTLVWLWMITSALILVGIFCYEYSTLLFIFNFCSYFIEQEHLGDSFGMCRE